MGLSGITSIDTDIHTEKQTQKVKTEDPLTSGSDELLGRIGPNIRPDYFWFFNPMKK